MRKTVSALCTAAALGVVAEVKPASAQEFYIGQIILGGWTFCPRGTTAAAGQTLDIASHTTLFALYGCTFGGDCRTTMQLPDLRGRYATSQGQQPGLTPVTLGQRGGAEITTMNVNTMANHTHSVSSTATADLNASDGNVNSATAAGAALANQPSAHYAGRGNLDEVMEAGSVTVAVSSTAAPAGNQQSFSIKDPFLGLQHCVVMEGLFPPRS